MPSLTRRTVLAGSSTTLVASGCIDSDSSSRPAHTVSVYLGEREETHNVTVTVTNDAGDILFEQEYALSDGNEADEDATFPQATAPANVIITVDGTRFERDWPGMEDEQIPCDGENWAGIEVYVKNGSDDTPEIRLETNCQQVFTE